MNILITGVGGLLGGRLAQWLLKHPDTADARVVGVDDFSCGYPENVPQGVELHELTLGAGDRRLPAVVAGADYVFHFAAYAAEGLSPFIRCYNYRNNLVAHAELLNAVLAAGTARRFVFTSSMAVYGRGNPPFDEDDPCRPIDPYGIAKRACELDLAVAGEQHGLDWCVIRPHNLYGPGQSIWQEYRNVLGIWMARRLEGRPLLVYGDGAQRRAFSYIDDCLPCLWAAARSPAASRQVINLGGTTDVSIGEAAELCCEVTGGGIIHHAEPRHEVRRAWCRWEKSVERLGFVDRTGLRAGLERMWAWAQRAWREFPQRRGRHQVAPIELERGLYSYWRTSHADSPVSGR
jgi:UDP-glucose 4-epimerase